MNERIGRVSLGLGLAAGMWAMIALLIVRSLLLDAPAGLLVAGFFLLSLLGFAMGIVALVGAARRKEELPTTAVIGTYFSGLELVVASAAVAVLLLHA